MKLPNEPMTKVFVCSPFRPVSREPERAEEEKQNNIKLAQSACRLVTELGMVPIAPHLFFPQFMDDNNPNEREKGMLLGRELLCGCDELWVFGERISEGMQAEIRQAKESDITVRYCDAPLDAYAKLIEIFERFRLRNLKYEDNRSYPFAQKVGDYVGIRPMDISFILFISDWISGEEVRHES